MFLPPPRRCAGKARFSKFGVITSGTILFNRFLFLPQQNPFNRVYVNRVYVFGLGYNAGIILGRCISSLLMLRSKTLPFLKRCLTIIVISKA